MIEFQLIRLNPLKAVYNTMDEKTDEMKQQLQQQQQQKKKQDKQNNQKTDEKIKNGWTKYFRRGGRQVSSQISQRDLRRSTRTLSYGDVPDGEVTFDVSMINIIQFIVVLVLYFQLCHEWGLMKNSAKKKSFNGVNSTNDGKLAKPGDNNNNNNNYGKGRRYKRRFAVHGKKWHENDTENIKHLGDAILHFEETVLLSLNKILGKKF